MKKKRENFCENEYLTLYSKTSMVAHGAATKENTERRITQSLRGENLALDFGFIKIWGGKQKLLRRRDMRYPFLGTGVPLTAGVVGGSESYTITSVHKGSFRWSNANTKLNNAK